MTVAPDLDAVVRMRGELFQRIRTNCCNESGLTPGELDRHAAAITLDAARAHQRGPLQRRVPNVLHDLNDLVQGG